MTAPLTRDAILAAPDLPEEVVEVPEWGGQVRVRGLNADGRDAFEMAVVKIDGKKIEANRKNIRATLVALCCVQDGGERLFTDADVEALGKKSAVAMDRVFAVAQRLSGLGPTDLEALEKN